MRTCGPAACAVVLILGVSNMGCGGAEPSASSASTQDASNSSAQGDGIHEYRAVCTEKALHDGNEVVLTKWLDSRREAADYADFHSYRKGKGHVVRIEERVKPKRAVPPQ